MKKLKFYAFTYGCFISHGDEMKFLTRVGASFAASEEEMNQRAFEDALNQFPKSLGYHKHYAKVYEIPESDIRLALM